MAERLPSLVTAGFGAALLLTLSTAVTPASASAAGLARSLAHAVVLGLGLLAALAFGSLALAGVLARHPRPARTVAIAAIVFGVVLWGGGARLLDGGGARVATNLIALPWLASAVCFGLAWRRRTAAGGRRRVEGELLEGLGTALLLLPAVPLLELFGVWRARAVLGVLLAMAALVWLALARASPPDAVARLPGGEQAAVSVLALAGGLCAATQSGDEVPLRSVFLVLAGGVIAVAVGVRVIAPGVFWGSTGRRAGTVALATLGVLAMHRAVAAPWSGPAAELPPIEISRETTWITEPLREDGTPDYVEWLNRRQEERVASENNAAVPLVDVLGVDLDAEARDRLGLPETGGDQPVLVGGLYDVEPILEALRTEGHPLAATPDFEDELQRQYLAVRGTPWRTGEHPLLDAWLGLNEPALARVEEATRHRRFWLIVAPEELAPSSELPSLLGFRTAGSLLQLRALRSLGDGRWDLAARDVLAIHRLGSLVAQDSWLIARLIGVALRGLAAPVVLPLAARIDADHSARARELLRELEERLDLPTPIESLDESERILQLAAVLHLRRLAIREGAAAWADELEPSDVLAGLGARPSRRMTSVYTMDPRSIDWNRALCILNKIQSAQVELASAEAPSREALRRGWAESHAWLQAPPVTTFLSGREAKGGPLAVARASLDPTRLFVGSFTGGDLPRANVSWNEMQALYRLGLRSLELGIERATTGSFAAERELAAVDGYRFRHIAGPADGADPARVERFAITAVPVQRNETGVRGFCVDGEGAARVTHDGAEPGVEAARCVGGDPLT